jgi:hypothetical protein
MELKDIVGVLAVAGFLGVPLLMLVLLWNANGKVTLK